MKEIIAQAYDYAKKIAASKQNQGFKFIDLHIYTDENGNFIYAKLRLKNSETGEKFIRSISMDDNGNWQMKEPNFSQLYPEGKGLKPLYRLEKLAKNTNPIYFFEGEQKADIAVKLGFNGTTTGGCGSLDSHYLQLLSNKEIFFWRDNDEAGKKYLISFLKALVENKIVDSSEIDIKVIDVDQLDLPLKGDIVDYVEKCYVEGDDDLTIAQKIKNLPTLTDEQVYDLLPNEIKKNISQKVDFETIFEFEGGFFELHQNGLYYVVYDRKGEVIQKTFICAPLKVIARTRDVNNQNWGILCQWSDLEGIEHTHNILISLLHKDSREYRQPLANNGLNISTAKKSIEYLDGYLNFHPIKKIALCVDKVGWHGNQFVTPNRVFGQGELIVYQHNAAQKTHYKQKGNLESWRKAISEKVAEQFKIVFAISIAFSGQLLPLVNENGGGFHFVGSSSKGKSLTLKIACAVWGLPKEYIHSWRATSNSQENIAAQHNHGFIALDEINLANPSTIGDVVYMLADGEGKDRMSKDGQNRPKIRWQVMYLSTGEETLESIQKRAGKTTKAGQEVRFISLDAVTNEHLGIFDTLIDGFESSAKQAEYLSRATIEHYGVAGQEWLEFITHDKSMIEKNALNYIDEFLENYSNLSSQAGRVARLFAVVAAAGELATHAGITGWLPGTATTAAQKCFENWLSNYGQDTDHEEQQILKQIRSFIQQHGESRFSNWKSDGFIQKVNNRVGYIRNNDYLFFKENFVEACDVFNQKLVIQVLKKHNLLKTNETGRDTFKIIDKEGQKSGRYYYISNTILTLDTDNLNANINK
ncbi:hypothetical protein GCM10010099_05450 [Streptomyces cinereus]|nr:hypothetical protein GCM10010099_05450 [Streptomyces cinereus]